MTIALIIVGDEILAGHTHDVNTLHLAQMSRALGYRLTEVRVVPDDREAITRAVRELSGLTPVDGHRPPAFLFVCGGIGPTPDDVTHEAVAAALEVPLERSPDMVERITEFYRRRRWCCDDGEEVRPNAASLKMADIPRGMKVLQNDKGTAPGMWRSVEGTDTKLVVLPGPPGEVRAIFQNSIAGKLMPEKEYIPAVEEVRVPHGESLFAHILEASMEANPAVEFGSYPQQGVRLVIVRLTGPEEEVRAAKEDFVERLRDGGLI